MSFDIFIHPIEGTAPLDPEMARALSEASVKHGGPAEPNKSGYHFDMRDGGGVEFYAGLAKAGGMLSLRRWGEAEAGFLFDVLDRTGWLAVIPSGEPLPILTVHARENATELVGDLKHVVHVARSQDDVLRTVERAFGQWANYRDQVVKG